MRLDGSQRIQFADVGLEALLFLAKSINLLIELGQLSAGCFLGCVLGGRDVAINQSKVFRQLCILLSNVCLGNICLKCFYVL